MTQNSKKKTLKRCPHCHHQISKKVTTCPYCGYHFNKSQFHHHISKSPHVYKRMQHTKIKQPSLSEALKLKCIEWKHDLEPSHHKVNSKHTSLTSALHFTNVRIIWVGSVIVIFLILLGIICVKSGSSKNNDNQTISHNTTQKTTKTHSQYVKSRFKYPIKHVWSAMQDDLDNRAVSQPYARYFVNGRHNSAYTSLVSWKAQIFNTTPAENLSGIRTKPEHFALRNHRLIYTIKYEFPQNNNQLQIQKYHWYATIQGHRIFNMYSSYSPISSKIIDK